MIYISMIHYPGKDLITMNEFIFKANYHQDPSTLHVGCEAPRAYFIPYQNEKTAMSGNRNASHRFLTLCCDWDFTF